MSKTSMALIIKFALTFGAAAIAFYFIDGNTWGWVFSVALVGTILNYVIGDLGVLPKFGNIVASVGDGALGALTAYFFSFIFPTFVTSWTSLLTFAIIIMVAEFFFHMYLAKSDKVAP